MCHDFNCVLNTDLQIKTFTIRWIFFPLCLGFMATRIHIVMTGPILCKASHGFLFSVYHRDRQQIFKNILADSFIIASPANILY